MLNMLKAFSAAFLAVFSAASLSAQQSDASLQSSNAQLPSAPQSVRRPAVEEQVPFISVAAGFTYLQTDLTNTPGGSGGYVLGWYGIPEVHLTKHVSLIGDFTNFNNYHAHMTENVHGFTGGPLYALSPFRGITAYGFVEGGAVRDSKMGSVVWTPATVGGVGLNFKLTHAVAFQLVPGEYVGTHLPNGNWQSNFNTKAGFVFTSFRLKHHS